MSNPKITAKNLSYDASLPPFLQRLHNSSNNASLDGRHERAVARPRRARDADADKEDEPVFVDEETGEVVSAEDFRALGSAGAVGEDEVKAAEDGSVILGESTIEVDGKEQKTKENKQAAKIGASRKRKAAKIIGGDDSGAEDIKDESRKLIEGNGGNTLTLATNKKKVTGKNKDKEKRVKLSFGDDEEV